MQSTSSSVDVAIIGAGAAGIAAARTLRDLGCRFLLLEATAQVGGRARTDTQTFGVPWDRGCHWLHAASHNPLTSLADHYGFHYRRTGPSERLHVKDHWASPAETEAAHAFIERSYESAHTSHLASYIVKTACPRWEHEPYIRGAYSAACPGQAWRRADLARLIEQRLFFADEATSITAFSTAHGAFQTGIAAAQGCCTGNMIGFQPILSRAFSLFVLSPPGHECVSP